jgi:hypothetical protein
MNIYSIFPSLLSEQVNKIVFQNQRATLYIIFRIYQNSPTDPKAEDEASLDSVFPDFSPNAQELHFQTVVNHYPRIRSHAIVYIDRFTLSVWVIIVMT